MASFLRAHEVIIGHITSLLFSPLKNVILRFFLKSRMSDLIYSPGETFKHNATLIKTKIVPEIFLKILNINVLTGLCHHFFKKPKNSFDPKNV